MDYLKFGHTHARTHARSHAHAHTHTNTHIHKTTVKIMILKGK